MKGIYLEMTNCTDASRHEEYNRWYSHSHIADLSVADGFVSAQRYVNAEPDSAWAQYLALYQLESDDLAASLKDLGRIATSMYDCGRQVDCFDPVGGYLYNWIDPSTLDPLPSVDYPQRESPIPEQLLNPPPQNLARISGSGLLIVTSNCDDQGRDLEYNRWYTHTHQPDLRSAIGLAAVNRYRNMNVEGYLPVYMATYQFETQDLWKSRDDFFRLAKMTFPSRHIDCHQSGGGGGWFHVIDDSAYKPLAKLDYPKAASGSPSAFEPPHPH